MRVIYNSHMRILRYFGRNSMPLGILRYLKFKYGYFGITPFLSYVIVNEFIEI